MDYQLLPFRFTAQPVPPKVIPGQETIRLAVSEVRHTAGLVEFDFHVSCLFPVSLERRYHDLGDALVLVVQDVDQRDGFALRLRDENVKYPPGEGPRDPNLIALPPLPIPARGEVQADAYAGVYRNGALVFRTVKPVSRPGVFLYVVLENHVSNTVGLDLVDQKAISY